MPREKRKANAITPVARPPGPTESIPWNIVEEIHVTCPVCSLLAKSDFFHHGPYPIEVKLKRYGGSSPSPTGKIRARRGFMEYTDLPDQVDDWRRMLVEKLQEALAALEEQE